MPVNIEEVTATVETPPPAPSSTSPAGNAVVPNPETELRKAREQQEHLARRAARIAAD